ncbi:gamma-aminobutyric acid receptor subunit beta-like [Dendronephthya gigantea]|uniref:gamma-aminobutyric acid receptor subunit beta-like n=1 Tax=Dendronephthya gigantea TaxID=151771 RepID=UPI00106929AA|nr:gamma-aminobutyric acid receptor subunit beta-like [Dendronephthya gigantea]
MGSKLTFLEILFIANTMMILAFYSNAANNKRALPKEESWRKCRTKDLLAFLRKDYDNHVAPGQPLELNVELVIESFDDIKESSMEFSLYVYLVQRWTDSRLKNVVKTPTVVTGKDINLFWIPDTYCVNARQSDLMMTDEHTHSMIKLDELGRLTYSRGAYLKTSCLMDLRDFPMDHQKCSVHFSSYGYSVKSVLYTWNDEGKVSTSSTLIRELAQFVLSTSSSSTRNVIYYSGNFTVLTATFEFKRRVGYYLLQVYLPCAILVMLSWIAFWMDKCDTGNRLTVGVTTILTIMFLLSYGNSSVPKMSYVKAMDIYLLSSFAFIFFSLIESVLCWRFESLVSRQKESHNATPKHMSANDVPPALNENSHWRGLNKRINSVSKPTPGDNSENSAPNPPNQEKDDLIFQKISKCLDLMQATSNRHEIKGKKKPRYELDTFARVIFPVAFVVFNIIYWSVWPIEA